MNVDKLQAILRTTLRYVPCEAARSAIKEVRTEMATMLEVSREVKEGEELTI